MNELTRSTAGALRRGLREREFSAVELTRAHLARIGRIDGRLGAFLRLDPRAEAQAAEADRRIAAGEAGPLTGIPVAVKDNLATRDLETTCASRILAGHVPARDAGAVARLRRAGAVVLGKTNLDEFSMGSSTEHSAVRPTRNPWNPERVPGGSSGGSAAAVAAGLAPLALGSDTGGSIRQPSAMCGIAGLKPTYGRVSRSGLIAFGSSLDQVGPMARDIADTAELLTAIAGHDADDATSSGRPAGDWTAACGRGVRGLRIGLPTEYLGHGLAEEIELRVREAAAELERQGATIETVSLPHTRWAVPTYYVLATAEASSNLARFDGVRFGRREDDGRGLDAMYRRTRTAGFGAEVQRRIMLGTYALSAGYHDRFYGRALHARRRLRADFLDVFASGVDVVLTPVTPTTAFAFDEKTANPLEMYLSDVFTVTANLAGLPALSVPLGRGSDGLPIGCQLLGPDFEEERLFRVAGVLERSHPPEMPGDPGLLEEPPRG